MGALLGFMMGYVLGAKAGPERYDELRKAWEIIANSEEFQGMLGAGMSFFQSTMQQGQLSIGDTLGGLLSGKGQLAESFKSFSSSGQLMDAWGTLSKSPEIQSLISNGVSMIGGMLMQGRESMER